MSTHISIGNLTIQDKATGIGTVNMLGSFRSEDAVQRELAAIRQDLARTEQLNAAIASLEQAIREQNQPSITASLQQLTSNFASSFLANLVSGVVGPFLSIR